MGDPPWRTHPLPGITDSDFGSNVCACTGLFRRDVKARRSVEAVAVEQCHRRHLKFGAARHQHFRQRSTFEKTEGGAGMEFHIHYVISVVDSDQVPAVRGRIASDTAAFLILSAKRDVPLFARPVRIGPPCPTGLPWTRVFSHDKFLTFQEEGG